MFCLGSETARDVAKKLLQEPILPKYHLKNHVIPTNISLLESANGENKPELETLLQRIEDYVDDFTGICQATLIQNLHYLSGSLLHGIESIFLNGISVKKLIKEG